MDCFVTYSSVSSYTSPPLIISLQSLPQVLFFNSNMPTANCCCCGCHTRHTCWFASCSTDERRIYRIEKKKPTADVLLFIGYYIVCGVQKWPADKQSLVHI